MTKRSQCNGKLAAGIDDIRAALARLASNGEAIRGFSCDSRGARIEIDRPRRNWLHGEPVGERHTQFGKQQTYRATLDGCAVIWTD